MKVRLVKKDGSRYITDAEVCDNGARIKFSKEKVDNSVDYIDFLYDYFVANEGDEDLRSETEESLIRSAKAIKLMEDDYEWMREVRYAYMDKHTVLPDGTAEVEYSNGIKIVVDYNAAKVTMCSDEFTKERYVK